MSTSEMTLAQVQKRAARKLRWAKLDDWPSEHDPVSIGNEAGEWLCSYEWSWLERPPANLSIVAGQPYCVLPTDFGRHVEIRSSAQQPYGIRMGDMVEVVDARRVSGGQIGAYIAAYSHTGGTTAGPKPAPRLELGPIPTVSRADVFVLVYYAGWTPLTDTASHVMVPSWLMGLYVAAVCAYLGGYERELEGTIEERLEALHDSQLFKAAWERDWSFQSDLGLSRRGVGRDELGITSPLGRIPLDSPPIVG